MSCVQTLVLVLASLGGQTRGEVLEFSSVRCGPCQRMSPLVSRLEREGLPIRKIDVDQNPQLANQYNITSIPAFVLVVDGREVDRTVGIQSESQLRRMIAAIPVSADESSIALGDAGSAAPDGALPRDAVDEPLEEVSVTEEPQRRGLFAFFEKGDEEQAEVRGNEELPSAPTPPTNTPLDASTRIRATVKGHINLGSGTVIDSRAGRTLIATCGHIFRDMDESTKVEVDLFEGDRHRTYVGKVLRFDLEADVGLLLVPTENAVSAVRVASSSNGPQQNDRVACIGCSAGDDPTREQLTVTAINKYKGPDNIECTGIPVQGRSGGGLFNADGELIGVCIAADPEAQRGLYAHAFALHKLLDACSLSYLYQQPAAPAIAEAEAPATPQEPARTGSPFRTPDESLAALHPDPAVVDLADGDAEVVVIIRSRSQPQAPSRVVIINQASQKFFAYLNGELESPSDSLLPQRTIPTTRTIETERPAWQHEARRVDVDHAAEVGPPLHQTALSVPAPRRYVRSDRARLSR